MSRWQEIVEELAEIDRRREELAEEWSVIKSKCEHPNLPKRGLAEDYADTCPDCGYLSYQYAL